MIYWKTTKHLTFATIVKYTRQVKKKQVVVVIKVVFINKLKILLKKIIQIAKIFKFACMLMKKNT